MDDWGVQSPPQQSIQVPLPFSEGEPGSLGFIKPRNILQTELVQSCTATKYSIFGGSILVEKCILLNVLNGWLPKPWFTVGKSSIRLWKENLIHQTGFWVFHVKLLETNSNSPLKIKPQPKKTFHLPAINFQGLLLLVPSIARCKSQLKDSTR